MAETALAIKKPPSGPKTPSRLDRARWYLFKQRVSTEEIALRHRVSVAVIQASIDRMEEHRGLVSAEEVDMAANSLVLKRMADDDKAISRSLKAKHIIRHTDKNTGKSKIVGKDDDHQTQLAAVDAVQKMANRSAPKGTGVQVNVQQNAGGGGPEPQRQISFEERLRKQRALKGLTNVEEVQDVEYVNEDETDSDAPDDTEEEPGT